MKSKILIILLLVFFNFLLSYDREQASRYAHRYTILTEGDSLGYNPDSLLWYNVNPFIYTLERQNNAPAHLAGYYDRADCSHFVSQCLQAGGIAMYESGYNNFPYLGAINCKNLHLFSEHFADSLGMTFHSNFWLEEVIEPVFENNHFTDNNYDAFFFVPKEVELMQFHFAEFNTDPFPFPYDEVTIGDFPFWNPPLVYMANQGEFWTDNLVRYAWQQYVPEVHIEYHPYLPLYFGFEMDSLKWQAELEPDTDYEEGDFQIFCNLRTDNIDINNNFAIFYNNDYNNVGRTVRYRHAAVCRSGSGNNARVSAHNFDRNDSLWCYAYCPANAVYDSLKLNCITFYHVNVAGSTPNLLSYNEWGTKSIITTVHSDSTTDKDRFEVGEPVYIKYAFRNNGSIMIPDRFKVRVEYGENHTLIDSVLHNGIFIADVLIDTLVFGMPELDSLTITIKLDAGINADNGTDWEAAWNDQNWLETFEADNNFSKTIYLYTGLQTPTNPQIELNPESGTIDFQWDGNNRSTYKVYSSITPYDGFAEDLTGTYSGTSWTAPQPTENRFYYVVETDGRNERKSKSVKILKTRKK